MKTVHVGFDCDGVIRNLLAGAYRHFTNDYPQLKKHMLKPDEAQSYVFGELFKTESPKMKRAFGKYCFENPKTSYRVFRHSPAFEQEVQMMRDAYDMFKKAGMEVSICTTQKRPHQKLATLQWLQEHAIPYDNVIMVNDLKGHFGLDWLLDDHLKNIIDMDRSDGSGVLRVRSYNRYKLNRVKRSVESIKEYADMIINEEYEL